MSRLSGTILVFIVAVSLSFAQSDSTKTTNSNFDSPSWIGVRSLVIPGWGQYYNGHKLKSGIIAGTQLTMAYSIILQNERFQNAKSAYDRDTTASSRTHWKAFMKFYENDRNKMIWWSAGAMLYSVYDAFVDAHLKNFEVGSTIEPTGQVNLRLSYFW